MILTPFAETIKLKGQIQDQQGTPIAGAQIQLVTSEIRVTSDKQGNFAISGELKKPHNILFMDQDTIKLSDFGFAIQAPP